MLLRATPVLIGAIACVVSLAACTTTSPGQAEPGRPGTSEATTTGSSRGSSSSSTSTSVGELPSDGAPKVRNPLAAARFEQNPCLALTDAQAKQLNIPPQGMPADFELGKSCEWLNRETFGSVAIDFLSKDPRGLSGTYKANKDKKWAYFEVLPEIEGFPAVAASNLDDRKDGRCVVEVGLTDRLSFSLTLRLSRANVGQKNPCDVAVQVAGMALQTMKAGG